MDHCWNQKRSNSPMPDQNRSSGGGSSSSGRREPIGERRWRDSMRLRLPPEAIEWTRSKREGGLGGGGAFTLRYRLPIGFILVAPSLFTAYGWTKGPLATTFFD